jgi:hypothetical protein
MYQQQWARISLYVPPGIEILGARSVLLPLNNLVGSQAEAEFTFSAVNYPEAKLELIVDVALEGRHSSGTVKITLMHK